MVGRVYPAPADARQSVPRRDRAAIRSTTASASAAFVQSRRRHVVSRARRGWLRGSCRRRSPSPAGRPRSPRAGRGACAASFARPAASTSSVSAANPTSTWPARRAHPARARMSGVGSSTRSGAPASFFSFASAATFGPEVGDGGGHHDGVGSRRGAQHGLAHLLGGLTTRTTLDARRAAATVPGPRISVDLAPRAPPPRRRSRCPSCRWSDSRGTARDRSARGWDPPSRGSFGPRDRPVAAATASAASTAVAISSGSREAARPLSPCARGPLSGPTTRAPRLRERLDVALASPGAPTSPCASPARSRAGPRTRAASR